MAQLNEQDADRALANGGLALAGNLGNTLGTPVLAAIGLGFGYSGMLLVATLMLSAGAVLHLRLAQRRRA